MTDSPDHLHVGWAIQDDRPVLLAHLRMQHGVEVEPSDPAALHLQLHGEHACESFGVEVTSFGDISHRWRCTFCGNTWGGDPIH